MKTYTYQVEREDQDLVGNRGVIMGDAPPPERGRTRTRTMAGFDVTLPASKEYKARKEAPREEVVRKPVIREEKIVRTEPIKIEPERETRGFADEQWVKKEERLESEKVKYTIQKGDTLQKISDKFYGTTRKWSVIYEANKGAISEPSKIYPGQVIVIPPIEIIEERQESEIK
jgi:nucleoid-associated protein YgaU